MKDVILSKLDKVQGKGNGQYRACCPSHGSTGRTLSLLFNSDGRILIHCHAGCEASEVLESIGLSLSDLYPEGAIRDFMASAKPKPKTTRYKSWLELFERQKSKLQPGERMSPKTLSLAREMFLRNQQHVR